jgi:hypothetical protein
MDPLLESKTAEAAHAAAVAKEAEHQALVIALKEAIVEPLQQALTYDKPDRPALVARIPVICNDIKTMKDDIKSISDNITWGVRIVVGAVVLALIGLVITTSG